MSGLYSPINRLAESITRPKGTGAEYMTELQKKPGYKPAEAEDRDLQTLMALPQMERAAFMEKLKAQANKFPLKMRELGQGQTHHDQYTLPGGENYREILLHTPMPEGKGFEGRSHHFGGMPNILASIRVKDRMSPEGKKMLHLEEIQSDWHQQGREAGYHPKDLDKEIKEVAQWKRRLEKESTFGMDKYEYAEHKNALEEAEEEHNKLLDMQEQGVPYGPHAKDWHELALKAMIQHAAENGYDQIGVTPGAEQAKRFSLSKQVGSVSYDPINRHFQAFKPNRETITSEKGATPERIQALIGKEAAAKLLQAPKTMGHHYLEGENLDIGGEGMKGFYDRMVPTFLNKFGKKHGVQVQQANLSQPQIENRNKLLSQFGVEGGEAQQPRLHTFDITPAMREDVLKNGIPRYDEGGIIHKAEGGSMQEPSIHQMRSALMGKPNITSLSNLQSVGANEAPGLPVKSFIPPQGAPTNGSIPVGGVDENVMQPGQQMMPQQPQQQPGQPGQPQAGAQPQQGQPQPQQGPQSNILSMTPQGQAMSAMRPSGMADGGVARFAKGGKEDKPLHYAPSPALMKAEIEAHAERMARQVQGLDNPNQKTQQQLAREQSLPVDIRSGGKKQKVPVLNMENFKGAYSVGVPGDPSRGGMTPIKKTNSRMGMDMPKAGEYLHSIGDTPLESPVPLYGGKDYGAYGHPKGWASDLGASAGMFNVVKRLAQEDPERSILGQYHKMSPESLHHAMHMLDSVLAYHQPHKQPKEHIDALNHLMRNITTTTAKADVPYPEFPGFENPNDVMLHGALNAGMRKKLINVLGTHKHFPGGKQKLDDLYYAISHPELRNIETGAGGSSMLQFDPSRELRDARSRHPTYGHDIPSKLIGKLKYPTPADLLAPRSMHNARQEIAAMGKKVVPFNQAKMSVIREPIDEQYINQLGEYENAMRKRLGYKKGGGVKLHTDQDTMALELSRKQKVK